MLRLLAAVLAVACGAGALSACAQDPSSEYGPRFVTPPLIRVSSVLWPVPLQLVGAEPGSRLRLTATLTTERGTWRSSATYSVPPSGTLDLASARPQLAPFAEPDSIGLYWSLRGPELTGRELARQWMRETLPMRLTASEGDRIVAERTFQLPGLAENLRPLAVYTRDLVGAELPRQTHEDQPLGRFWSGATLERPRTPAVLMFDDPSPGASASFAAPLLVQLGASVLVLPVTAADDGVRVSSVVDSTTVEAALDWLSDRPDIDEDAVFAYGTGVSEQLALWAATRFPSQVHGLFAAAGSPVILCMPSGASPVSERGSGLPCRGIGTPVTPASLTPVDGVDGPVVLACATRDEVVPNACRWHDQLAATRRERPGDAVLTAAGSAHALTVPPGLPVAVPDDDRGQPTERARIAFWNAVGAVVLRAAQS